MDVDNSQAASDDEGDEGDEGEDDGSDDDNEGEGEGDDDQDQEDHEHDNATLNTMDFTGVPDGDLKEMPRDISSSPDFLLSAKNTSHIAQGSPLKHAISPPPPLSTDPVPIEDNEAEADGDDDDDNVDNMQHHQQHEEEGHSTRQDYYISEQQNEVIDHGYDELGPNHNHDDDEMLLDNEGLEFMDHTNPATFPNPTDLENDENENLMEVDGPSSTKLSYGYQDEHGQGYSATEGGPTSTGEYVHAVEEATHEEQQIPPVSTDDVLGHQPIDAAGTGDQEEEHESYADLLGSLDDHLNEQSHETEVPEARGETEARAKADGGETFEIENQIEAETSTVDAMEEKISTEEAIAAPEMASVEELQAEEPATEDLIVVAETEEKIEVTSEERTEGEEREVVEKPKTAKAEPTVITPTAVGEE
jgi:hypothetical protein